MKKVIFSIIAFGLIGLSLVGCGKTQTTIHTGGATPEYISFSIIADQSVYNPGDPVKFTVSMKNMYSKSLNIKNEPHVLVGSVLVPPDKYTTIPLSAFKNQTLKPNQTIKQTVTWKQKGQTGWYNTQMGKIDFNYGELSGGESQFFVNNPNVLIGTIKPNATIKKIPSDLKNHNATFVIKRIDFSKQYTKVYYEINTDKKMTTNFQMSLNRSNGINDPALKDERKHIGNGISGVFYFNPTLKSANQIKINLSKWEFCTNKGCFFIHGNWEKSISIKDVK